MGFYIKLGAPRATLKSLSEWRPIKVGGSKGRFYRVSLPVDYEFGDCPVLDPDFSMRDWRALHQVFTV